MSRWAKVGVVVAGYLAAVVAGVVAAQVYNARMAAMPYDTSGGMYAGGEAITSLAVFLMVALVPTLLALWFLRRNEGFWNAVARRTLVAAIGVEFVTGVCVLVHWFVPRPPGEETGRWV